MTLLLTDPSPRALLGEAADQAGPAVARPLRIALIALGVFFVTLILWGSLAPLSKAAIAPGLVQVEGRRRVVQHLEGGIITEILVHENQRVRRGQPLIRLDAIQSGGANVSTRSEYLTLIAEERRLRAELGQSGLSFPDELAQATDARAAEIMSNQRAILATRQSSLNSEVRVLRESAAQASATYSGLSTQISALRSQLPLLRSELATVRQLVSEQLERRSRQLELERTISSIEGQVGSLTGQALSAQRAIAEANAKVAALTGERRDETTQRLRDVQLKLTEAREKYKAAADIDQRRTITAPVDGQVVGLRYTTVGGVISAGQPVLDIVPDRQAFIIVARVRPVDIENVHMGLPTEVKLLPFSGRSVPMLDGRVVAVAGDASIPQDNQEPYYEVRIQLDDRPAYRKLSSRLVSGMPAEAYIVLGDRSLIAYLFQPLTDSFRRAFREF